MAYFPSQDDIDVLFQKTKQMFVKILLLNKHFQIIDEIQGELISGKINIDANSDIRRTADLTFIVKDKQYFADLYSKIWIDKYIDIHIGVYHNKSRKILWYPTGIYIFNDNRFVWPDFPPPFFIKFYFFIIRSKLTFYTHFRSIYSVFLQAITLYIV